MQTIDTAPRLLRRAALKLGMARGAPRIYIEGKYLLRAGFQPATRIEAEFGLGRVTLRLAPAGTRRTSSKGDGQTPVIDINTSQLRDSFGDCDAVSVRIAEGEIVITPERTQAKRRTRCRNGRAGGAFGGGGLATQAERQAGFKCAFNIEVNPDYARVFEQNHPGVRMFNMDIAEVPVEELPPVELLSFGIPCTPFSRSTRSAGGLPYDKALPMEAKGTPQLGDMTYWALKIIDHLNPAHVLVENAPDYHKSGACWILRLALERMGYDVSVRMLDPHEYGSLSSRPRTVVVATSDGPFAWPEPLPCTRSFADIMDPPEAVEELWFDRSDPSKQWLFNHWEAQGAKGNGFQPPVIQSGASRVPTLKKRYYSGQGDNFLVGHPTDPGKIRWLTLEEGKRLQELPEHYDLGPSRTTAGEILGQGVLVRFFERIFRALREGYTPVAGDATPSVLTLNRPSPLKAALQPHASQLAFFG